MTFEEIEQAHARKQRLGERGLAAGSINKTLKVLARVLDEAIEDGFLTENPARGKRRRLKAAKARRTWLELDQVSRLIDAAGAHRALLVAMVLARLRVSELTALRWRDVDLGRGKLRVADAKTDAGHRIVDLSHWLTEELTVHKQQARRRPGRLRLRDAERDATEPLEHHAADPPAGDRAGEREARRGWARRDRRRHESLAAPDVRLAPLRGRRVARVRDGADGPRELGARSRGLLEGDGAEARNRSADG